MVDFKKRLEGKKVKRPVDPLTLYETLDRAHDKGPLRPSQIAVLKDWFEGHQATRDVILKLHTGQGKTLVGLLMLQSRLNSEKNPVVYLCPDNFLIAQTCEQARQFGIATCEADPELPDEFLNGERILVTSVQKLFNGLTRFGLKNRSINVGTLLMDDAHACADIVREACRIRVPSDEPAYAALRTLFSADLEQQGVGTFADIRNGKRDSFLPVPYWSWIEKESDVASILSRSADRKSIKFAWPLLKDLLRQCQCVVSGVAVEIEPYVPPLTVFGTYWGAKHRIFMSATVTDDAFLVKGLQLAPQTIANPITYAKESWSGEKMVLIPSLIDDDFNRERVVKGFGGKNKKRRHGIVVLAPSFAKTKDWEAYGSLITDKETVWAAIEELREGKFEQTVVLVNRYDGVDLPDDTCRILIFDERPFSESLVDLYQESCRPNSGSTLMRTVRSIEQGMGRSVRGEKDYSVIVITGTDLTRLIRDQASRKFLSPQMSKQIEIGIEIAEMARQEIDEGEKYVDAFNKLIRQCVGRDDAWKAFYVEQMETVRPRGANASLLRTYEVELTAEQAHSKGDYTTARDELQGLLDTEILSSEDRGWYLQQIARYLYLSDRAEADRVQVAAFNANRFLLKPPTGVTVAKLSIVSQGRMERIAAWIKDFESYPALAVALADILGRLTFGTKADKFEHALDELSQALGFAGERPDKEWKEGPDNLWALDDRNYILWECKSEVDVERAEINKSETEQMNRSAAWFEKHYAGLTVRRMIVHPAYQVASAAALTHEVEVMREKELRALTKRVSEFFKSFELLDFKDLSTSHIQKLVNAHKLTNSDLLSSYARKVKDVK